MGMALPGSGCFLFGDEAEQEGASPVQGGTYCVPASEGPSAAWAKAEANGTEPIRMWALWPKNVPIDDVIASPTRVNAWLDDEQRVMDYLRVTRGNAESYRATLAGRLGRDLSRARRAQEKIIADKVLDPKHAWNRHCSIETSILDAHTMQVQNRPT